MENQSLEKALSKLISAINSIKVGFITINEAGEIETINTAAKSILYLKKKPSSSFENPDLVKLNFSLDDVAQSFNNILNIKQSIQQVLSDKKPFTALGVELDNLYVNIYITPTIYIGEEVNLEFIGVSILIEDVTEEKLLDRSRTDFFSIASHELKTPLIIIKGNLEIIQEVYPIKDVRLKQMLADTYHSANQLIQIVDDFLDLSHLEQSKIDYQKVRVDLTSLVKDTIDDLQLMANQKHLYVNMGSSTPAVVLSDPERTKQVITNLLSNAIKFTNTGSITFKITDLGNFFKTSISDTGVGISSQNQMLIFKKFQLAGTDLLTRNPQRSTGVGLYLSKMLIEGMGGRIWLERSVEHQGSIFSFTLPKP